MKIHEERDALLEALARDWRQAPLDATERALCAFADKLTRTPGAMREGDLTPLREAGLEDEGIHHAIQVIGYFNYINRLADAMHVDLEPEMPPYPEGPTAS